MKRIAVGVVWFVLLWLGAGMIGGGIAGVRAQSHASSPATPAQSFSEGYSRGYDVGQVAGREFGRRYGAWILGAALVVSIVGTATGFLPGTRRKAPTIGTDSSPRSV